MAIKISSYPIRFKPTLETSYTAGDSLFAVEPLIGITKNGRKSTLIQLGIFWDTPDAPEIILYFFDTEPTAWGVAGEAPAPTFDDRASIVGVWEIDDGQDQGYQTLPGDNSETENSFAVFTGDLAHFNARNEIGYMAAIVKTDVSDDLTDKLAITLQVRK